MLIITNYLVIMCHIKTIIICDHVIMDCKDSFSIRLNPGNLKQYKGNIVVN